MSSQHVVVAFTILTACALGVVEAAADSGRSCPEPAVVFDESAGMTAPEVVQSVSPTYPEDARDEGVTGTVVLDAVIDDQGAVTAVRVLEDPDPRLSDAASAAVRSWRFKPATDGAGEPLAVCYVLTVKFRLE